MENNFTQDLDQQMQSLIEENSVLERLVELMGEKAKQDKMQSYIYSITKQKLKHNYETIVLYNNILDDIHGKKGIVA